MLSTFAAPHQRPRQRSAMASKQTAAAPPRPPGVCERLFNALSLPAAFRPLRRVSRRPHPPPGDSPAKKKEPPFTVRTVEIEPGTPPPPPAPAPPTAAWRTATEKKAVVKMGLERGKAQQTEIGNGPKSVASPSKIGKEKRGPAKAKSDINERVEEYIKRTKLRFRTPTGIVGKPST